MKFAISRASYRANDRQPCPGAEKTGDFWTIEIQDLTALMNFKREHGDLIISDVVSVVPRLDTHLFDGAIEIYDDYIE